MQEAESEIEVAALLTAYQSAGGVLEYVFLVPDGGTSAAGNHRLAAIAGMEAIGRHLKLGSIDFELHWDESRLVGRPIAFPEFWGTDDVEPKQITRSAWSIPPIDGYKPAFFQ